jgi:hypothetical protein
VHEEETPTGQLESVDSGYSQAVDPNDEEAGSTVGGVEQPRRPYGGVYDVEADGWG